MMIVVCGVFDELFNLYTMFHYFAAVRLLCSYLYKVKWTPCNTPPLQGVAIKLYIIGYPARGGYCKVSYIKNNIRIIFHGGGAK